jgi:carboxyl-terminal processing protease
MKALSFSLSPSPPPPQLPSPPRKNPNFNPIFPNSLRTILLKSTAAALSFSLVVSAPIFPSAPASASDNKSASPLTEICGEVGREEEGTTKSDMTNEALVEEAWEVVNQSFLPDVGTRPWSPEMWLVSFQLWFALAFHRATFRCYCYYLMQVFKRTV